MKISLDSRQLNAESFHYYDSNNGDFIYSMGAKVYIFFKNKKYEFNIPIKKRYFIFEKFRLFRRLLRLDMMNVFFNYSKDGLIIIFMGELYFFDLKKSILKSNFNLRRCRNVPYNSIAVTKKGIYFGEYSSNKIRNDVNIWCSRDDGVNWEIIYKLSGSKTRHIHGIYHDKYTDTLWICTGDSDGECFLYNSNEQFTQINSYGDGTQKWRSLSLIFEEKFIIWGMDSNIEKSRLVIFNRKTHQIELGQEFPGPIWYSKNLDDGISLISSAVEIGKGVKADSAFIFYSKNNRDWKVLTEFKKDILPMPYFKYGVISFCAGSQNKGNFIIFGEGLVKLDGKSYFAKFVE